jgi:hypothetical protein
LEEYLTPDFILAVISAAFNLTGIGVYNYLVLKKKKKPNATMWAMWAGIATASGISYFLMNDDVLKAAPLLVGIVGCNATFLFFLVRGKFNKPTPIEQGIIAIGLISITAGLALHDATYTNILLQFATLLSFLPIFKYTWERPDREHCLPWLIWSMAFGLQIIVVWIRWEGHWTDIVAPINVTALDFIVLLLALRRR